jgi:hypothetical protein
MLRKIVGAMLTIQQENSDKTASQPTFEHTADPLFRTLQEENKELAEKMKKLSASYERRTIRLQKVRPPPKRFSRKYSSGHFDLFCLFFFVFFAV